MFLICVDLDLHRSCVLLTLLLANLVNIATLADFFLNTSRTSTVLVHKLSLRN